MIFLVFLSLFILVIVGFLFLPIELIINTAKNQYQLTLKGIARMWLEEDEDSILKIGLKVFFFTHYFFPFDKRKRKIQKTKERVKKKNKNRKWSFGQIVGLLRTFELKRFWLDIDTGNYITNAKLYPFFALVSFYGLPCQVNFRDTNRLVLQIQNKPIRLLKSFIKYKTQSHGITF